MVYLEVSIHQYWGNLSLGTSFFTFRHLAQRAF